MFNWLSVIILLSIEIVTNAIFGKGFLMFYLRKNVLLQVQIMIMYSNSTEYKES